MEHAIHALHSAATHLEPGSVTADEPNAIAHRAKMLAPAGREIVEHSDFRAVPHEAIDDV